MQFIGLALIWFGVAFCAIGVLGVVRFPDVYTRIHATGKAAIMGLFGILIGTAILVPDVALPAVALAIFMVITSPVSSHSIASAAHRSGVPVLGEADDLLELGQPQPPEDTVRVSEFDLGVETTDDLEIDEESVLEVSKREP